MASNGTTGLDNALLHYPNAILVDEEINVIYIIDLIIYIL
jgi:hypothetical protein